MNDGIGAVSSGAGRYEVRQIELVTGDGKNVQKAVREAGITNANDYRWRKACDGLRLNQAHRLK